MRKWRLQCLKLQTNWLVVMLESLIGLHLSTIIIIFDTHLKQVGLQVIKPTGLTSSLKGKNNSEILEIFTQRAK